MQNAWKTLAFAIIFAVFGVLQAFDWISLTDQYAGLITTAIAAIMAVLRFFTGTVPVVVHDKFGSPSQHTERMSNGW